MWFTSGNTVFESVNTQAIRTDGEREAKNRGPFRDPGFKTALVKRYSLLRRFAMPTPRTSAPATAAAAIPSMDESPV